MEKLIKQIYEQARAIGACDKFKGNERTLEDILALFTSRQGLEFCMNNKFPNINTMRKFKTHDERLKEHGIYIDAGAITLQNPRLAILIGRTSATVTFDELKRHEVYVLQGAKCTVGAWKWSVVRVQADEDSEVIKSAYNNAVIL